MILNIGIRNFRSFKERVVFTTEASSTESKEENVFEQPLQNGKVLRLLKLAIIFGANGSGKTSFITFLYRFKDLLERSPKSNQDIPLYDPFLLDETSREQPIEFDIEFIIKEIKYRYELQFNRNRISHEVLTYYPGSRSITLFERKLPDDDTVSVHIGIIKSCSTNREEQVNLFANQLFLSLFGSQRPHTLITPVYNYFSDLIVINGYNSKFLSQLKDDVCVWLKKDAKNIKSLTELLTFADTGISGIDIDDNLATKHNYKVNDNLKSQYFPFKEESLGTRSLFAVGGKILQAMETGTPIFVDEIDANFHTYISSLIVRLFQNKRINRNNSQLIMSTHDTNLLDSDIIRKDQVWFTEKNQIGYSDLFSLSDFTTDVRENTPFSKWYMAGKFGAVPTIKSLETLLRDEED